MEKKRKINKKSSKQKNAPLVRKILPIFALMIGMTTLGSMTMAAIIAKHDEVQGFTGVQHLNPEKNDAVEIKDEDKIKYGTDIYAYHLSKDEEEILHERGYTLKDLEDMNPDDYVLLLYGAEADIQNRNMYRYRSPYKRAKEPSQNERTRLYESMVDSFRQKNYSNVVYQFQKAMKKYTFEMYKDEPITSLYHDAAERINTDMTAEEIQENGGSAEKNWGTEELKGRKSAIAVLYDTFTLQVDIFKNLVVDRNSCLPIGTLSSVDEERCIDVRREPDYQYSDMLAPGADLVYEYDVTDSAGRKALVLIQSTQLDKELVGVYYEDGSCPAIGTY